MLAGSAYAFGVLLRQWACVHRQDGLVLSNIPLKLGSLHSTLYGRIVGGASTHAAVV